MIVGVGSDLTDLRRIEAMLARHGERFLRRCFTDSEIGQAEERRAPGGRAATYARRFAAKEACAKALGTGFQEGIRLRDIGVVNDARGLPSLVLTGGARARLEALTPQGKSARLHLSLSDEPPLAQAFVVIEVL